MPHKHKRRQNDDSNFNLPPTTIAKPLPVRENNADSKKSSRANKKKSRTTDKSSSTYQDDTPRDFARMMARMPQSSNSASKPPPSSSDSNKRQNRKRKRSEPDGRDNKTKVADGPKIFPGERMSDFSARVNQELPLTGTSRKAGDSTKHSKDAALRKLREDRQTKHERKLRRLQTEWRKDEERIREKEAEEREEREEKDEEMNDLWKVWEAEAGGSVGKKKKKGKMTAGKRKKKGNNGAEVDGGSGDEDDDDDDDPWAKLNRKAHASRPANPFDVAQAPPESLVKPKEKFKVRGMGGAKVDVADVPAASGSLRRREELATERKSIVERYRKLVAEKNG